MNIYKQFGFNSKNPVLCTKYTKMFRKNKRGLEREIEEYAKSNMIRTKDTWKQHGLVLVRSSPNFQELNLSKTSLDD